MTWNVSSKVLESRGEPSVAGEEQTRLPFSGLREITIERARDLDVVAELHMELLESGPMAGFGEPFIREVCYRALMKAGVLHVALGELNGQPVGFVAYTADSFSFHRIGLRQHWLTAAVVLIRCLLAKPSRLRHVLRAARVLLSRRSEQPPDPSAHGEIVCIAVRPGYLKAGFKLDSPMRISEELVDYAGERLRQADIRAMRMLVDADNKAVLFLYHSLGARFEPCMHGGEPTVQVWFDLTAAGAGESSPP